MFSSPGKILHKYYKKTSQSWIKRWIELLKNITRKDVGICTGLVLISFLLNITGLDWGIPSQTRSEFYPKDISYYQKPYSQRLYQTAPFESYHPDETAIINALSNMDPGNLDFNPHFFNYPSLCIYLIGVVIKTLDITGFVEVVNSKEYYIQHPEKMGSIYLAGRYTIALMSTIAVIMLYLIGTKLFNRTVGVLAGINLAILPLWVRNSHFMTVDVPATTLMVGTSLLVLLSMRKDSYKLLLMSAFLAGLSASTKYPAGIIIVMTIFGFLKYKQKSFKTLLLIIILFSSGFIVATPYVLLSTREFLGALFYEKNSKLGIPSLHMLVTQFMIAHGLIQEILVIAGVILVMRKIGSWKYQFISLWIIAGIILRLISMADYSRYLVTALPPLSICAALSMTWLINMVFQKSRYLLQPLITTIITTVLLLPTLLYTLDMVGILEGRDVRNIVSSWIDQNVDPQQQVGTIGSFYYYSSPINAEKFQVIDIKKTLHDIRPEVVITSSETQYNWNENVPGYSRKSFHQRPNPIWTWPVKTRPSDWGYTFLDIHLYLKNNYYSNMRPDK